MPEPVPLVSALILERPLCLDCIKEKAGCTATSVQAALEIMGTVFQVRREHDRCRACGTETEVMSLDRPLN